MGIQAGYMGIQTGYMKIGLTCSAEWSCGESCPKQPQIGSVPCEWESVWCVCVCVSVCVCVCVCGVFVWCVCVCVACVCVENSTSYTGSTSLRVRRCSYRVCTAGYPVPTQLLPLHTPSLVIGATQPVLTNAPGFLN